MAATKGIKIPVAVNASTQYRANITSEHFMFGEMKITAGLMAEGLTDSEIVEKIVSENLFQHPTEKKLRVRARTCVARLKILNSEELIKAVAKETVSVAKQVCLYAMMRQERIVWEFMITAIGEKIRLRDYAFSKSCINVFLLNLQAQNDEVSKWSPRTISRIGQVLGRILIENGYIESNKSTVMTPPIIDPLLEKVMKLNGDTVAISAFESIG